MAIQTLNTIKNWFRTGLKPSEAQFWDTWDSFWHKSEPIPTSAVEQLDTLLNDKASQELVGIAIDTLTGHMAEVVIDIDFINLEPFTYNVPVAMKLTAQESEGTAANLGIPLNTNMERYDKLEIAPTQIGLVTLKGTLL
jgi:hypothetical protein